MRRYMQGTLDFACGVYAVINAIVCTKGIDLAAARMMFQQSQKDFSADPRLWRAFLHNETDHYWVVRYMLHTWCGDGRYLMGMECPWGHWLSEGGKTCCAESVLENVALYLPENHRDWGPEPLADARNEAEKAWATLRGWFADGREGKAALLRFHRFLPGVRQAIVSHWTCVRDVTEESVLLHDASAEYNALHSLERTSLIPPANRTALVRVVPESIVLLSR